jgi:hypothetical protein
MAVIAFETVASNGSITIPEQYRQLFSGAVRLLVRVEPLPAAEKKESIFKAARISTKGFRFNREEANER